jgi:hypothetical protein
MGHSEKALKMDAAPNEATRERLSDTREGITWRISLGRDESVSEVIEHAMEEKGAPTPGKIRACLTAGEYRDGRLGEIFIVPDKEGSLLRGLLDGFATMVSISLQSGVSLGTIVRKFANTRFHPQGVTNDPQIPMATSILDFICRKLALRYLSKEELEELGIEDHREKARQLESFELAEEPEGDTHGKKRKKSEEGWKIEPGWKLIKEKVGNFEVSYLVNESADCYSRGGGTADFSEAGAGKTAETGSEQGRAEAGKEAAADQGEMPA